MFNMSMKSKKFLNLLPILIIIIFSLVLVFKFRINEARKSEPLEASTVLEIATDPAFPEYKGQIVAGFPADFPVYMGATLVGSAKDYPADSPKESYRVKWDLIPGTSTLDAMRWYKEELTKSGWNFEDPNDWTSIDEFVAKITRDSLGGFITVENESGELEVLVSLKNINDL
jgi:hypothetical protein